MVSLDTVVPTNPNSISMEPNSSPRISFSAEFLDERNFISISPNSPAKKDHVSEREKLRNAAEFEFLSSNLTGENMHTADELFFEGKLLPFWQIHHSEKLNKISLKTEQTEEGTNEKEANKNNNSKNNNNDEPRMSWFLDDDPSPRPPKCTVLWKELLRLKKQRASSLSPSSSTSSSSSASSLGDISASEESKDGGKNREKHVKRIKKGLERTRSASLRIRPMVNVPICTQGKNNAAALPPLFSLKKGRLDR